MAQARRRPCSPGASAVAGAGIGCSLSTVHTITSSAPGSTSSDSASSVSTSPSTTTSTGFFKSNSIRVAVRLEAIRVPDMRAGKQSRQIPHQAQAADRSPVNVFNRAAVDRGLRRDHHFTAGVLTIAKGNKQAAPVVALAVRAKRKRAAAQPGQGNQHPDQIAGLAQKFQAAIGQCRDVRGETHVQRIDVKDGPARVVQANDVAGTRTAFEDRLDAKFREVRPVFNEVSKKRIAGSEGKKSQGGAAFRCRVRKKSVDDLEARAVAAHGNEFAKTVGVSAARVHGSFSGSARFAHFEGKACRAEPLERARGQLSAASAAGCRIHDREIGFVHRETIAPRSSCLPICPARMTRLIFIAALRGKS